jgi:Trypsin-co-occurring domain 1
MSELVRFPLAAGGWAVAEVDSSSAVVRAANRGPDGIITAATSLDRVMDQIREVADTALRSLRESVTQPDEIAIEFGVALSAQAGGVLVKGGVSAHIQVRLSWTRSAG